MQLTGNTICITGGGSGIGRGLAEEFLKRDNTVIIAGRSTDTLAQTASENPGMEYLQLDVASSDSISAFVKKITKRFPTLNTLINNAGMMASEELSDHDVSIAEATIEVNLLGPIRLTSALLPHLLSQTRATVANVTSGLAFVPLSTAPTYCATKAALHSYSLSLREQLRQTSVSVIEIAPPYVQTSLTGEQQANDPAAMPLQEYIAETITLLEQDDDKEILVERVQPLRYAERNNTFEEMFAALSEMGRARAASR